VENHMPQTIVIDEIGTELEALAAGTIAQRGVQLVGTAHGMTVENLIKNPSLQMLVGGIQSVTLGDEEARRRHVQKSVLERQGPPTFTAACEMVSRTEWRVHYSLAATVDAVLTGKPLNVEIRRMTESGQVVVGNGNETTANNSSSKRSSGSISSYPAEWSDQDVDEDDEDGDESGEGRKTGNFWEQGEAPLLLYIYQVNEESLEQVMEVMGLEKVIQITDDIGIADAVLALRSRLKQNSWVRGMAKFRQLPIFAIKANTMAQMVRAMRAILGMESLGSYFVVSSSLSNEEVGRRLDVMNRQPTLEDEIEALEEARVAVEQIVIPKGQPAELLPRSPELVALQVKLVEGYQLASETAGSEKSVRLRILPARLRHSRSSEDDDDDDDEEEEECFPGQEDNLFKGDLGVSITGGTSPSKLPILPE